MRHTTSRSARSMFIVALAGLSLLSSCMIGEDAITEDESEIDAVGTGNIITAWATIAADAIVRPDEATTALRSPGPSSMLMAQVQLAVYDTMVAIGDSEAYDAFSYKVPATGNPNRNAAVATAAYRILRTRVPLRGAYLDAQYALTMNAIADGIRKTRGVALGEKVAAHYLALRANDNIDASPVWVQPTPGPGVFEPVVATPPVDYKMVFVPPFTFPITASQYFFPPPPPALTSAEYGTAWTEVRDLGRVDSTIRTEDKKQLALWTGENPFRWGSRNLTDLAIAQGLTPMRSARFFALVFTTTADALQSGMSAKYHYNLWRPFHSIPRADTDGNDVTVADPTWKPLLNVNHPEYPAGHAFFSAGSMVGAVRAFFRTDNVSWTLTTVGVTGLTQTSRSYTSINALATDITEARIYAGLHYRFAVEAGLIQGRLISYWVSARFFRRCD